MTVQIFAAAILAILVFSALLVRRASEGEALLIFRSERPHRWVGPGTALIIPGMERIERCPTRPKEYVVSVGCFSRELCRVSFPVAVMWQVVDPLAYHSIDEIHRTRILTMVTEAVTDVVSRCSAAQLALTTEVIARAAEQLVAPALREVGVGLIGITIGPPAAQPAVESAWSRGPIALADRAGIVAEAETAALVARLELGSTVEECYAFESVGRRVGLSADRLYERHTRRKAAVAGSMVVVSPPPDGDSVDHTPVVPVVFDLKRPA